MHAITITIWSMNLFSISSINLISHIKIMFSGLKIKQCLVLIFLFASFSFLETPLQSSSWQSLNVFHKLRREHQWQMCYFLPNLSWFRQRRKQYIEITNDSESDLRNTICGVPQCSILGTLFFLVYVNDLPSSSQISNAVMFADDTTIFYEYKNIKKLFAMVNKKLIY